MKNISDTAPGLPRKETTKESESENNTDDQNNNNSQRPRTTSTSSFYSVKSWKSVTTSGEPDFYSICSVESFKST